MVNNKIDQFNPASCAVCAGRFSTDVISAGTPPTECSNPLSPACVANYAVERQRFVECTGGWDLYTAGRTKQCAGSTQWTEMEQVYRPFPTYFTCRTASTPGTCRYSLSGFFASSWDATDACSACLVGAEQAIATACSGSANVGACVTAVSGQYGFADEYLLCSGAQLSTSATPACSASPSPGTLFPAIRDYVLSTSSVDAANVPSPAASCSPCYQVLGVDMATRLTQDPALAATCTTAAPYTCVTSLSGELARFQACSSFSLTACSANDVTSIKTHLQSLSLSLTSGAVDTFMAVFSDTLPCKTCIEALAKPLLITRQQVTACAFGIGTCALTAQLAAFNKCAGTTLKWDAFYTPVCLAATVTPAWFRNLNYCGWGGIGASNCMAALDAGIRDANLNTEFASHTLCATECAAKYIADVTAVFTGTPSLRTTCGGESVFNEASLKSATCLRALRAAIDAFN